MTSKTSNKLAFISAFALSAAAVFTVFVLVPQKASAATGLTIQPVKISQDLTASSTTSGDILLTNASDSDVKVTVSVADFVPLANTDTLQFINSAAGVTSVKDWVKVNNGVTDFTFKKGAQVSVPYTITAPKDAEPGSHFGVIFFKADSLGQGGSLQIGAQVGVLVLVTIPGNFLQKGEIESLVTPSFLQSAPVPFKLSFKNTGTVYFEPKGTIVIKNMFGQKVDEVPINGTVVLPTGLKTMEFDWNPSGLIIGRYTATATVLDSTNNVLSTKTVVFYVFPVWYALAFLVLLVILFIVFRFLKARVNISVSLK
jgi:hypothetical protein